MELKAPITVVAITAKGGTFARHGLAKPGDAGAPCFMVLRIHGPREELV